MTPERHVLVVANETVAGRSLIEAIERRRKDGAVRVGEDAGLPLHHFPLEKAGDAHAAVESGVIGKVLIDIA